jgi:hypothetical protein
LQQEEIGAGAGVGCSEGALGRPHPSLLPRSAGQRDALYPLGTSNASAEIFERLIFRISV